MTNRPRQILMAARERIVQARERERWSSAQMNQPMLQLALPGQEHEQAARRGKAHGSSNARRAAVQDWWLN